MIEDVAAKIETLELQVEQLEKRLEFVATTLQASIISIVKAFNYNVEHATISPVLGAAVLQKLTLPTTKETKSGRPDGNGETSEGCDADLHPV